MDLLQLTRMLRILIWYWFPPIIFAGFMFFLSTRPDLKSEFPGPIDFALRKIAHVLEYFILTILLSRVGLRGVSERKRQIAFAFVACLGALMTAVFDESIQRFVPGRVGSPKDVLVDSIGISLAFTMLLWYFRRKSLSLEKKGRSSL